MKVWVVVGDWGYDGKDVPLGVFETKEAAQAAATSEKAKGYDDVDVLPYDVGEIVDDMDAKLRSCVE